VCGRCTITKRNFGRSGSRDGRDGRDRVAEPIERMRDTRRAEARQGRHIGPVPVGYVRGTDGKLQPAPHAPDREAVQVGFQLYATGNESGRTVTIKLNEAGYTWPRPDGTRMPFHKDGVIEMLQIPCISGVLKRRA
jgi:hypothetical protein